MEKLLGLVLLATMFISGCGTPKGTANKTDLLELNPSQVVEAYYHSIATGDYSTAKATLSDDIVQTYTNSPDSDFQNIRKLTDIKISNVSPITFNKQDNVGPIKEKYYEGVQVTAEYVAEYKEVITSHSGKQIRFIYVARKEQGSPWKMVSIGTGP